MAFRTAEMAIAWYYATENNIRCRSAECRVIPVGPWAGAPHVMPPSTGVRGKGPEPMMAMRGDIGAALEALTESQRDVLYLRLHKCYTYERLGELLKCHFITAFNRYTRAMGIARAAMVERGVVKP